MHSKAADRRNDVAPVWVHNKCGPRLSEQIPSEVVSKANEIKNTHGSPVGKGISLNGGGHLSFEGSPANDHEYQLAVELALLGKNVDVTGGRRV